ncbi:MAG: hypothetical protein Q8N61_01365 [bacterium]|nr:hypothetical protein [bacterium]
MRRAIIFCFLVWLILIVWAWRAWAGPFLACDLPEPGVTIAKTEVEITKVSDGSVTVVAGLVQPEASAFKLLDLAGFAADRYHFRARWCDVMGLNSEWSLFLIAGKPAPAVGLRVVP